jgi:hypothetical protein
MRKLSTGEPCAGELHARFGGRGELRKKALLYPYSCHGWQIIKQLKNLKLYPH